LQVKVDASGSFDEEQNVQDNNSLYIFKLYYIDIPGKFYLLEKEEKNMINENTLKSKTTSTGHE